VIDAEPERDAGPTYLVRQRFRYEYARPVRRLRHRLMVVPPDRHGDQRTLASRVSASVPSDERRWTDEFGNACVEFAAPDVDSMVEFAARIVVSRAASAEPFLAAASWLTDPRLLEPTPLTAPPRSLAGVAARLRARAADDRELAMAANRWTHSALAYERGATGIRTTAAEALALGRGVCQDYAHLMLGLCRLLGLPARYVSGHLLGEGGTHAWVEVLLPDPAGSGLAEVLALDPTHGGPTGPGHVTVATGRDYLDVAPTSGTYVGEALGRLSATRRVDALSAGGGGAAPAGREPSPS
jgi:transglutaminase-like putative cysteine protease